MGNVTRTSIRLTDKRQRKYEQLEEATGHSQTVTAIDHAVNHYLKMRGNNQAIPHGRIDELMDKAEEKGGLTPQEIASILSTEELPISYESSISIGSSD